MIPAQVKPTISPELLDQIDVRVGTIESVSDVTNSEKLVALRVNFGDHVRTVLAGMKRERANPREIEGKQALFVVNLPPRKMAGIVSGGCFSTSAIWTGLPRYWRCRNRECLTEPERDDNHGTDMKRTLLSWSSGKDSAWSLHVLRQQNEHEVVGLLTTFNQAANRVAMHAVRRSLVEAQAKAAGIPLLGVDSFCAFSTLTATLYQKSFRVFLSQSIAMLALMFLRWNSHDSGFGC